MMKKWRLWGIAAILPALTALGAAEVCNCRFTAGQWNPADFTPVKSSRWEYIGSFKQEQNHIVNAVPADADDKTMLNTRAGETYAAMIFNKELTGNHTISVTMSFDYRMAPSIVIAEKPGSNAKQYPEFRTHYEIVLYDQGLNIWRHWFVDGKQVWKKVAFLKAKLEPKKNYTLIVSIQYTGRGPVMTVSAGGHSFGVLDPELPKSYYAGIVACEGVNRFYDFKIE